MCMSMRRISRYRFALLAPVLLVLLPRGPLEAQGTFIRGDATGDLSLNIADPIAILGYLFLGERAPACLDAADVDDSGHLDLSDAIALLGYLFLGTAPP